MDLSEYLQTTLGEFFKGITAASEEAKKHGASVNPPAYGSRRTSNTTTAYEINDLVKIEFDVAVVVRESAGGRGGAKISVAGFGAELGGDASSSSEKTNRMRFTIPVQIPVGPKLGAYARQKGMK